MPESPLFDLPMAEPVACPRCGRLFEAPVTIDVDGQPKTIRGHVQGDPTLCIPLPGVAALQERDARKRRAVRRGR